MTRPPMRLPRVLLGRRKTKKIIFSLWKKNRCVRDICEDVGGPPNTVIERLEDMLKVDLVEILPNKKGKCPDCNRGVVSNFNFCPGCGKSLEGVEITPSNKKTYTLTDKGRSIARILLMNKRDAKSRKIKFEREEYE